MMFDGWLIVDSKCKTWKPHQVFAGTLEDAIKFFTEMFDDQQFIITERKNMKNILYVSPPKQKLEQLRLF
jgi:hypothetical protein